MNADVIVIGAGFAGLTAAARAGELGLRVLVLEQGDGDDYHCNSRYSGGYVHVCMDDPTAAETFLGEKIRRTTEGFADAQLVDVFAAEGGRAIDWLRGHGVRFIRLGNIASAQWIMSPPRTGQPGLEWKGRGPDVLMRRLLHLVRSQGAQVMLNARATELVMADGQCAGVDVARNGTRQTFRARAVVIADGGFHANPALLRRYITGTPEKIMLRGAATGGGDGVRMAEAVGARLVGMECFYGHPLSRDAFTNERLWPVPFLDSLVVSGIVVNGQGRRFLDEGQGGVFVANGLARQADPLDAIVVFDDAVWRGPAAKMSTPPAPNPTLKTAGATIHSAPSIPALAALAGISADALAETIGRYNAAIAGRELGQLDPPRSAAAYTPYPVAVAPFHAMPMCAGITYTMGGPAIDGHGRVMHQDGHFFDTLFAIGSASGGLEGGARAGYVGGLAKAFILGLRSAEYIASAQTAA